jgi:vesicle-fusing ATPase
MDAVVANLPNPKLAFTNRYGFLWGCRGIFIFLLYLRVYLNKGKFAEISRLVKSPSIKINEADPILNIVVNQFVFAASPLDGVTPENGLAMNSQQRKCGNFTVDQPLKISPFTPSAEVALNTMSVNVDLLVKKAGTQVTLDAVELAEAFKKSFLNQVFRAGQILAMDFAGTKLDLSIDGFEHATIGEQPAAQKSPLGQLLNVTSLLFRKQTGSQSNINILNGEVSAVNTGLFNGNFNFVEMGIGGLDEQFMKMFRTAFASRIFPGVVKQLGTSHVRGILLFGPPGCGKTLIARQIGKILNSREPKIVNGPEIMDKYYGESERKIRELFADAETEQKEAGDNSMLHIIIFDEMDAIMKSRGAGKDSTGTNDSIVNQLLSKIDGVDSLNNILIIGMTNRKDLIDEAILRPGRLEVHIEITLPDEEGRIQILNIKTAKMREHNRMTNDAAARIPELAVRTKNYTGAELEGLVRNAASFALARNINPSALKNLDEKTIKVEWGDFEKALTETVPAYGNKDDAEIRSYYRNGVYSYGAVFDELWSSLQKFVNQVATSARTPLLSVLLEGEVASGKTALAAKLAAESNFPFVRMISPDSLIGSSEQSKCNLLLKIFTDSYRSEKSIIFIDDIERILEYSPVGPRYSNAVLQTLLILLRKIPPHPARLMVIATSSISGHLDELQLTQAFNMTVHVTALQQPAEFQSILRQYSNLNEKEVVNISRAISKPLGVKKLLLVLEMARAEGDHISPEQFLACLHSANF